jgi:hypothetical protein
MSLINYWSITAFAGTEFHVTVEFTRFMAYATDFHHCFSASKFNGYGKLLIVFVSVEELKYGDQ